MKKTSTKLFLAAAALGLAAASTVGSTYAWFTVNGSAKVSGMTMNVTGGSGIMIRKHVESGDPNQFTDKLDLTAEFSGLPSWKPCTPCSDTSGDPDLSDFKTLDLSKTLTGSTYQYSETLSSSQLSGYVYSLDLDVRVSDGCRIAISAQPASVSTTAEEMAIKSIRIGVVNYGDRNTSASGFDIYGLVDRSDIVSEVSSSIGVYDKDNALNKFNLIFNKAITRTESSYQRVQADLMNSTNCNYATDSGVSADNYTTERFTLKFWYEGDDPNCSDDILGKTVKFTLNFEPVK